MQCSWLKHYLFLNIFFIFLTQAAVDLVCKKSSQACDQALDKKKWFVFFVFFLYISSLDQEFAYFIIINKIHFLFPLKYYITSIQCFVYLILLFSQIEKVEDPKALFEKAQAFIKAKLDEINDGKKGGKN